jgi:hypothetical protein
MVGGLPLEIRAVRWNLVVDNEDSLKLELEPPTYIAHRIVGAYRIVGPSALQFYGRSRLAARRAPPALLFYRPLLFYRLGSGAD